MKTLSIPTEGLTVERLLQQADENNVIFLTTDGQVRFVVMTADEGDQEVMALRSNSEFLAYLAECEQRAKTGPTKSLQEFRDLYCTSSACAADAAAKTAEP